MTYDGLPEAKHRELHREVAEAIEARLSPQVPGFEGMLAYHFSLGRDVERAEVDSMEIVNKLMRIDPATVPRATERGHSSIAAMFAKPWPLA